MRYIYIILLVIISSCASQRSLERYKQIEDQGYIGLKYKFSDSGNRNIEVTFEDDSTLHVVNRTNIQQSSYLLNFDINYSFKRASINSIVVDKYKSGDKRLFKKDYLGPYNYRQYTMDKDAIKYIFPDIKGDTLRFSPDFKKLQILEFCFDLEK